MVTKLIEPKLFVIDVLDEQGKPDARVNPLYGCRFDEPEFWDLLRRYLSLLDIKNAKSIQIIADGAPWINYLDKHKNRTQYVDYKEHKLLCGSGIIESAIRRIVDLKFKNASTFWNKETVEKLFFFRATLLSNRWEILIQNLAKSRFV